MSTGGDDETRQSFAFSESQLIKGEKEGGEGVTEDDDDDDDGDFGFVDIGSDDDAGDQEDVRKRDRRENYLEARKNALGHRDDGSEGDASGGEGPSKRVGRRASAKRLSSEALDLENDDDDDGEYQQEQLMKEERDSDFEAEDDDDGSAIEEDQSKPPAAKRYKRSPPPLADASSVNQHHHELWMKRYVELAEYKNKYGHCLVPVSYPANKSLGQWVKTQRKQYALRLQKGKYSNMTQERIDLLEDLGFAWTAMGQPAVGTATTAGGDDVNSKLAPADRGWKERYQELVEYSEENGHCLVPKGFKLNPSLANWVKTQRRQYRQQEQGNGTMSADRIRLLEKIGFQWRVRGDGFWDVATSPRSSCGWMERFQELEEYHKEHGNCNVPQQYKPNPSLGTWVHTQRREFKRYSADKQPEGGDDDDDDDKKPAASSSSGGSCGLSTERVQLLDRLGFQWKIHDDWSERFADLERYHQEFGNCLVPRNYEPDPSLGRWVRTQRKEYNRLKLQEQKTGDDSDGDHRHVPKSCMTQERIDKLERLGFVWKLRGDGVYSHQSSFRSWNDSYAELKAFSEKHGHCAVSKTYMEETGGGVRLMNWIKTQRKEYKRFQEQKAGGGSASSGSCSMTEERIKLLEAIGFLWSVRPRDDWMVRYDQLVQYAKDTGNCLVPKTYPPNPSLGNWVATQRKEYKRFKSGTLPCSLTKERVALLTKIDFKWNVYQEGGWMVRYAQLKEYHAKHGDVCVPKSNPDLGNWVRTQRREYKNFAENKQPCGLTSERVELLEQLGFQWQVRGPDDWMTRYRQLEEYFHKNGNCLVPQRYPPNPHFGAWVNDQRQQFKHFKEGDKPSTMTAEKVELLEKLHFEWSPQEARWMAQFRALQAHVSQHGRGALPSYQENRSLRQWAEEQRKQYRSHQHHDEQNQQLLPAESSESAAPLEHASTTSERRRRDLLDSLGFPWWTADERETNDEPHNNSHHEHEAPMAGETDGGAANHPMELAYLLP